MARTKRYQPSKRSRMSIADFDEVTRKKIAFDTRPLGTVAEHWRITIPQVSRLRAAYRPIEMKGIGRPSTYDPEIAAVILDAFEQGVTWMEACEIAGVAHGTANNWLDTIDTFRAARARALVAWAQAQERQISELVDDPTVPSDRLGHMIKSRHWLMERQLEEYKQRTPTTGAQITINYLQLLQQASADQSKGKRNQDGPTIEHQPIDNVAVSKG